MAPSTCVCMFACDRFSVCNIDQLVQGWTSNSSFKLVNGRKRFFFIIFMFMHLLLWMYDMLDFICTGIDEL